MKKSSRNWTPDQDRMLEQFMRQNNGQRKLKWEEVALLMHEKLENCQKTGKQCRERWHNHLAPELNNSSEWTKEQNEKLFEKHAELGNKWAKIATFLKGRTDNCVKNHFYSTLRRGMRKVNNFIHDQKKQRGSIKEFKPDVLTKILIVADGDPQQKLNAKSNASNLSKNIKQLLIQVSLETDQQTYDQNVINKVISLILEFNKNCKKRKGKKKSLSNEKINDEEKQEENQEISQELQEQVQSTPKIEIPQQKIQKPKIEEQDNNICKKQVGRKEKLAKKQEKQSHLKENLKAPNNQGQIKPKQEPIGPVQVHEIMKQVKQVDLAGSNFEKEWGTNIFQQRKTTINRSLSTEGQLAQFLPNIMNLSGPFSCLKGQPIEPIDLFRSSTLGFSFTTAGQREAAASKQLLAESAIGITKGEAFNNLSAFSEKNSFLKVEGDKRAFEPDIYGQLRMSNISNFEGFTNEKSNPFAKPQKSNK